jgi:hypothetical protein
MGSGSSHLPKDRAELVEEHLRDRVVQLKPRGTALGICRTCGTVVYAGDRLAMIGSHVLHDGCASSGATRPLVERARQDSNLRPSVP